MIGAEIQKALYQALEGLVEGRVYDNPPPEPIFPYITIGDDQVIDDSGECGASFEVFEDVHIWDRPKAKSKAAVKELRKEVVAAVLAITSIEDDYALVSVSLESARSLRDPDGLTEHGVLTFRFLTQEK